MILNQAERDRVEKEVGVKANYLSAFTDMDAPLDDPAFREQVVTELIKAMKCVQDGDVLPALDVDKWQPMGWFTTQDLRNIDSYKYKIKWWTYLSLCWLGSKMSRLENNFRWKLHYFRKKYQKGYIEKIRNARNW